MRKNDFISFWNQLKAALKLLLRNDPLRLAGATAFFTTFALPFILIILIQVLSLLFNRRSISRELFLRLSDMLGQESVRQVISTIRGFRGLVSSWPTIIGGSFFMLFVATTLFRVIRNSINQLWMIRIKERQSFRTSFKARLRAFLIILFTGFLFIDGIVIESLRVLFGNYITELLPAAGIWFNNIFSLIISVLTVTVWFAMIFRYIPDGRPAWKIAFTGGLLTSILFNIGKFVLRWLLVDSNIGVIFGPSTAIVLLLLFVFYSAIILYYGAAFTKVWSAHKHKYIEPLPNAMFFRYADVRPVEHK